MAPAEVQLPNGMAWREGSALVYFVDSGEESITEYATDEQVGPPGWFLAGARPWWLLQHALSLIGQCARSLLSETACWPLLQQLWMLHCLLDCPLPHSIPAGYPAPRARGQAAGPRCGPRTQRAQGGARWHDN